MTYEDIIFTVDGGVATIAINRPKVMNAFRGRTCEELIHAFNKAGWDMPMSMISKATAVLPSRSACTTGLPSILL
jgi:2-ketocyclohexanecarboxyl-CoA hydrolase